MTRFSFDHVLIHVCIVKHFSVHVCVQFISLIAISLCVCIYKIVCMCTCVCLTLLASFFLPSHLSFKNMYM